MLKLCHINPRGPVFLDTLYIVNGNKELFYVLHSFYKY